MNEVFPWLNNPILIDIHTIEVSFHTNSMAFAYILFG
jgi:hypothetical protein